MNPWYLIGWIVAIFLTLMVGPIVLRLLWGFLVALPVALVKDLRDNLQHRRANAGKLRCQHHRPESPQYPSGERCPNIATRRTPNGFYCEDHYSRNMGGGMASYAFWLDHARQQSQHLRRQS